MLDILPETEEDTLALVITGSLTKEDYERLEPEMRVRAERPGNFNMIVELDDLDSMDPDALREDLRFTKEFRDDVDRMAVVTTDPLWRNLSDFVSKPAGKALGVDVERFDDRVGAWKWIRGES